MAKSPTERSRESRARKKRDQYLVTYMLGLDVIDMLLDGGLLPMCESQNKVRIQEAFARWIDTLLAEKADQ
jgi:hypothetical protein